MNGYQQQYSGAEGYSAQQPQHPSQLPRNMNTFAAKPAHPYSSYYDGAGNNEYGMYQGGQQQQMRQGPPPELSGYMQAPPRSSMNPNAAAFMPRQYEMPQVSRASQPQQQQQSYNPFGYNSSHRPMQQQQQQQQPPQSQSPYRSGPPTNFLGYSQQQQQPRNQGIPDYATVTGHYTPQQQQPQRIPPPSYHQQQQMSSQQQQQQFQQGGGGGQDPLSGLRTQLTQQKQLTEEEIKRQQEDQEAYASRFLAAVQERVSQPRPSSASAASQQQQQSNGVANNSHGTSLQNLAATLQQEGLGGYFDQDINTYDFEAQHNANPPFQLSQELLDRIASLPNKMILYEVQIGLEQLLAEPSEFDAWIVAIRDRLAQKDVTSDDLEAAAWLVIEMGIFGENAQYNFAKVCTYLYERLSTFKESLVLQIKEFHNYRSQYSLDVQQSLLVFIAELYVQAFAPVGVRNHPIPTILYEEFMDILNAEPMTDLLIKKVVQTLKLCGRHLETDIGENSMGELFKKLDDFTKEGQQRPPTLTETGTCFIKNLMLYRTSGWGGSINDSSSTTTGGGATSAPIRFAPDNMDLTEEEIRFLESNGAMEGGSSYSSGPSSNDIYDAEILEDYEKFLRDHAEQTAISAAEKALERLSMEEEDDFDSHAPHRDDNTTPTPSKS
jgi:hypothetical protein